MYVFKRENRNEIDYKKKKKKHIKQGAPNILFILKEIKIAQNIVIENNKQNTKNDKKMQTE